MLTDKKSRTVFLLILFQSLFTILAGLIILYLFQSGNIPHNTYIGSLPVGGISRDEAVKKLDDYYSKRLKNDRLIIIAGEKKQAEIKYSDIDLSVKVEESVERAGGIGIGAFINHFVGSFSGKRIKVDPIMEINEGRLKERLMELSARFDRESEDADIDIKNGKVVKLPEVKGRSINIEKALGFIEQRIKADGVSTISLDYPNAGVISESLPDITLSHLKGADEVVAQYSTDIKSPELEDSMLLAARAINKIYLSPVDLRKAESGGEFSFNKYLKNEDVLLNYNNEGYNQVASTLYAALLHSEVKQSAITRTPHKSTVSYISPGMDAMVMGDTYDLKFKNTTLYPMVVFAKVSGGKVTVTLVGKKKINGRTSLRIETEQEFKPSVEYLENDNLKPGERRLVDAGKKGLAVLVYKLVDGGGSISRQYLYKDRYVAVKKVVEIGPNTPWKEPIDK